ncbi:hypothetical protein FA15DRAFT_380294 [Coprinopsis marcescibilis]|uniref:Uncharacterized protein n=1 Tax=Coprinopsis marcescibilis TaxID=230819 RepID=A0A5C3KA13_COPMA|nr:hypothetical protein FA15DRAFT_380294 [Coprinopsis marcescibilis]
MVDKSTKVGESGTPAASAFPITALSTLPLPPLIPAVAHPHSEVLHFILKLQHWTVLCSGGGGWVRKVGEHVVGLRSVKKARSRIVYQPLINLAPGLCKEWAGECILTRGGSGLLKRVLTLPRQQAAGGQVVHVNVDASRTPAATLRCPHPITTPALPHPQTHPPAGRVPAAHSAG